MIKKYSEFNSITEADDTKYIYITNKGLSRLRELDKEWKNVVEIWTRNNSHNWMDSKYGNGLTFFGEYSPFTQRLLLKLAQGTKYDMEQFIDEFNGEFNGDHANPEKEIDENISRGYLEFK